MFVLLRHLQRMRREIALPAPSRPGSLALRHVDAGSCNGCEHELAATANPYYDLQRHGLNIVASPRHADLLLVTGPITTRMADPLRRAYDAMPEPRLVAALGDCANGCAALADPAQLAGPLEQILPVDLRIPGCPPDPQQIADALLSLMGESAAAHPTPSGASSQTRTCHQPISARLHVDREGAKHA
jgi:Ni,Fe-hydrogenase III small subunit